MSYFYQLSRRDSELCCGSGSVIYTTITACTNQLLRADPAKTTIRGVTNWIGWIGAVGSPVAFGGLVIAILESRAGRAERRDSEANQARLVTIERNEDNDARFFRAKIHNHSDAPVFDVRLDWIGYIEPGRSGRARRLFPAAEFLGVRDNLAGLQLPEDVPPVRVLPSSESMWNAIEWSDPDRDEARLAVEIAMTISFVDSHGRRWTRTNTAAPVRVLDVPKRSVRKFRMSKRAPIVPVANGPISA
jgi:hypothetical protein